MTPFDTSKTPKKPPFTVFLAAVVVVFCTSLSAAESVGFVPDYIDGTSDTADVTSTQSAQTSQPQTVALSSLPQLGVAAASSTTRTRHAASTGITPVRIKIPSVGINLPVQNPSTLNVDTLDSLLANGPAHYAASADLGEDGMVIIFAHSSHLPVVINKMYQAFNSVPDLKQGDTITVVGSDGKSYLYSVDSVVKADVNDGTTIDMSGSHGTQLTLVTCDTLTGKSARFVLTADFVGVE